MTDPVKSVLADAVLTISVHTDTEIEAIIRSLVGCTWGEEEGSEDTESEEESEGEEAEEEEDLDEEDSEEDLDEEDEDI